MKLKRPEFHFSEFQRVVEALPTKPVHTVSVWRVVASQVETVQVGVMTAVVPPGTFVTHRTRVRVSSAELPSKMRCQWITFKQQTEHWHVSQKLYWMTGTCSQKCTDGSDWIFFVMPYLEIPALCKSSPTQSIHRFFGLPRDRLLLGSHLNTYFTVLLSYYVGCVQCIASACF